MAKRIKSAIVSNGSSSATILIQAKAKSIPLKSPAGNCLRCNCIR